jgi:hypothetical protein
MHTLRGGTRYACWAQTTYRCSLEGAGGTLLARVGSRARSWVQSEARGQVRCMNAGSLPRTAGTLGSWEKGSAQTGRGNARRWLRQSEDPRIVQVLPMKSACKPGESQRKGSAAAGDKILNGGVAGRPKTSAGCAMDRGRQAGRQAAACEGWCARQTSDPAAAETSAHSADRSGASAPAAPKRAPPPRMRCHGRGPSAAMATPPPGV